MTDAWEATHWFVDGDAWKRTRKNYLRQIIQGIITKTPVYSEFYFFFYIFINFIFYYLIYIFNNNLYPQQYLIFL